MNSLFLPDGKLYRILSRLTQLLWINFLVNITSLPLFTIGASVTAMHKVIYALYRNEDIPIAKTFFQAFRSNFRQATGIWLFYFVVFLCGALDCIFLQSLSQELRYLFLIAVLILCFSLLMSFVWAFLLQSRYQNRIWDTIRLSFVLWFSHPIRTIAMLLAWAAPWLLLLAFFRLAPLFLFLGTALGGLLQATIYHSVFCRLDKLTENT